MGREAISVLKRLLRLLLLHGEHFLGAPGPSRIARVFNSVMAGTGVNECERKSSSRFGRR